MVKHNYIFIKIIFIAIYSFNLISYSLAIENTEGVMDNVDEADDKVREETIHEDSISVAKGFIDVLVNLTCETTGIGNLLRSEFSHTCVPESALTFVLANLISPGLYANMFLRLTINDDELFPDTCKRENKVDFNNQVLSFGLCNNIYLIAARVAALFKSIIVIAQHAVSNSSDSVWEKVAEVWDMPKSSYHLIYEDVPIGTSNVMFDLSIIPVFPWKVVKKNDRICLATLGLTGWLPVGCKYIKEPYPISQYASFMSNKNSYNNFSSSTSNIIQCAHMDSCYKRATEHSITPLVISSPVIECVEEMIAKTVISKSVCSLNSTNINSTNINITSSMLYIFQSNMKKTVTALLTIYVIFFGFRILLSGNIPQAAEIIVFVLKLIFVVYFSIGINIKPEINNYRVNGIVDWSLTFLLNGMTDLANWIIQASPSGLCEFNKSDYDPGFSHLALWDAIDCRVSHYLGIDMIQNMVISNQVENGNQDGINFPIPPYLILLIPALISGNFSLITLIASYPLLVTGIAAFVINATIICMVSIVILSVLAPIFVPMFLFNYTKGYFYSWVQLMISFMIQPMIATVFMITLMQVYDIGFYGTCKYSSKITNLIGNKTKKYFYINNDWEGSNLYKNQEEIKNCKRSLGYILNNPFQKSYDYSNLNLEEIKNRDPADSVKNSSLIEEEAGGFFDFIILAVKGIIRLIVAILIALFAIYLLNHASHSLSEFITDMAQGISLRTMLTPMPNTNSSNFSTNKDTPSNNNQLASDNANRKNHIKSSNSVIRK